MPPDGTNHSIFDRRSLKSSAKNIVLHRLGTRLKRARINSGKTQTEVGLLLDTSAKTVRNWGNGTHEPSPDTLRQLAQIYRIHSTDFLRNLDTAIAPQFRGPGFRYNRLPIDPRRLRKARQEAGLKQADVAEITGLSLSAISRYENGSANPAAFTLDVIATIYDRPPGWFTPLGFFTEEDQRRFNASVNASPQKGPEEDLVITTYNNVMSEICEEDKQKIANFILMIQRRNRQNSLVPRPNNFSVHGTNPDTPPPDEPHRSGP